MKRSMACARLGLAFTFFTIQLQSMVSSEGVESTTLLSNSSNSNEAQSTHNKNDILKNYASALNLDADGTGKTAAKYLCEAQSNCGGLLFEEATPSEDGGIDNETVDQQIEYTKLFTVPLKLAPVDANGNADSDDIFVSNKKWLITRGAVNIPAYALSSTVIHQDKDISIDEAREWCQSHTDCVAFSFPLQSKRSLNEVDEVIYVNRIADLDHGPEQFHDDTYDDEDDNDVNEIYIPEVEWITHIIHDRVRLNGKISKNIDLEETKWSFDSTTPYRPCCSTKEKLPTIDEIKAADTLERIDCSISREDFFRRYENPRIPVILTGCTEEWKANTLWSSFDAIQSRFENDSMWEFQSITKDSNTGEIKPSAEKTGVKITWAEFQEYYARVKKDKDYGSIRLMKKLEVGEYGTDEIMKDYEVPKMFEGADFYTKLPKYKEQWFPKDYGFMAYFIMGSYGTGTGPHADPMTTDAWSTLLSGHKWWVIYPKLPGIIDQTEVQCSMECSDSGSSFHGTGSAETIAWYASVAKHANKFYYGNGQRASHVLQRPGETIFLPHGMMHSVLNMDNTIAITEKFASEGNLEEVWREILTSGEEYDWQHLYNNVFNQTQRETVRKIVWPITKESIQSVTDNTFLYTRKVPDKFWKEDQEEYDEEEEEYDEEEEEDFEQLTLDEYDQLSISAKHIYLDALGNYYDFDPELVRPSEYAEMTQEEKEDYESEMRFLASLEYLDSLYEQGNEEEEYVALEQ